MIELKNVSKKYGELLATKNVSFTVQSGEIIGLLGVNGAGKTTIMKIITGYHNPHSGSVEVCGLNVLEEPVKVKKHIGYLPETNPLYDDLLVYEYLSFIGQARGLSKNEISEAINRVVKECALQEFIYKSISDLSKGMRQRVGLAQALLHNPDVLILDEPTSGLDPNQIKEIRSVIKEIGKTKAVMLSTHILQEVEAMCDRILIVNKGQIVAEGTDIEIATKLRGEDIYSLVLVGDVSAETISDLTKVQGIKDIDIIDKKDAQIEDDCTQIVIKSDSTNISGEIIFDWVKRKKLRLRSLQKTSKNLESIFESLTSLEQTEKESA